jgi:hypothetical protein
MARGFESKDVEYQQAEASRPRPERRGLTPAEREIETRRQTLEMALSRARAERSSARNRTHRQMLDLAIQALEEQLRGSTFRA